MYCRLPAIVLILLCLGGEVRAESEMETSARSPRWTVQLDPLTTALSFVHLQVEYAFSGHHSVYLSPHLRFFNSPLTGKDEDYRATGVETAYRYFWRGEAPRGPWVQARLVGSYLSTDNSNTLGGYVSAVGGYTWILQDRWVLALGLGVQYLHMRIEGLGPKGPAPAAHTAFGVAF